MIKEFKEFIARGNVIDLAVGIIIGGAFGLVIASLVGEVLMPVIGLLLGGIDFSNRFIVLSNPSGAAVTTLTTARDAGVVTLNYGVFLNAVVNFLIVAFAVFLLIKAVNSLRREQAAAPVPPAAPPEDILLLREIRDAVKR
jgi:large conductance mechanosensitive channel